jgi:hypothetical protein
VRIIRYVTEGSFDTYMWQTLERKAGFIAQVTCGDLPDRDVDDIGDQALSFAEVKALATGDPLELEKAAVDADVARLTRLERAYHDDQHRLRRTHEAALARAERAFERAAALETVLGGVTDTRGVAFAMTVDGRRYTKRVEAGEYLQRLLLDQLDRTPPESTGPMVEVGTLAGLMVTGQAITSIEDEIRLAVSDAHIEIVYTALDWKRSEPSSFITRLERHIQRLPETLAATKAEAEAAQGEAARAQSRLGAPWDRADELARFRRRQQEIDEQLAAAATRNPAMPPSVAASMPAARAHDSAAPSAVAAPPDPLQDDPRTRTADRAARTVGTGLPDRPSSNLTAAAATARLDALQARSSDDRGISL